MTGGGVKKSFFWFKEPPSLGIYDKLSNETNVSCTDCFLTFLFLYGRGSESLGESPPMGVRAVINSQKQFGFRTGGHGAIFSQRVQTPSWSLLRLSLSGIRACMSQRGESEERIDLEK